MTNSLRSSSELDGAFELLHPEVRRWVRDQGWAGLREIQSRTILDVVRSPADILVAASTAAGKTEAAFLPVLSKVADDESGLSVLYVAPLKALINDQFGRLELLCARLELPLIRWHGDAPAAAKTKLIKRPCGVALITPESIEALFSRRSDAANALFSRLRFIIIDEVHAFLAGPRGVHLASLLRRIDALTTRPARRIGLSATLGDVGAACQWLRPAATQPVAIVSSTAAGSEMQLQVRGYIEPLAPQPNAPGDLAIREITAHLMASLRGKNALVFGGSRQRVEIVADLLRGQCEQEKVPNEFFPHHGNLSKELREDLEARLKEGRWPTTAICTSTLELGIDIGGVEAVAQIGAPRSIASLRQRLGRSGRRAGQKKVLRIYVIEEELTARPSLLDQIRQEAIRAVAAIRLLGKGFIEGPGSVDGLGSALLHQTLSVITERGGASAQRLYELLCGPGPFEQVQPALYLALLRSMGSEDRKLIEQAPDGTLMLGEVGERLVASRDFFSLFQTAAEWSVMTTGKVLGALPINSPVIAGNLIVFAGRRWIIREVLESDRVLIVDPHRGGSPPRFGGSSLEAVDDRLAAEMLEVYLEGDVPGWIDDTMRRLLAQGRAAFERFDLANRRVVRAGNELHLFTWRGTRSNSLLAIILGASGYTAWAHDFGVTLMRPELGSLAAKLSDLQSQPGLPDIEAIAADVGAIANGKFDAMIDPTVLRSFWALGVRTAAASLKDVLAPFSPLGITDDQGWDGPETWTGMPETNAHGADLP